MTNSAPGSEARRVRLVAERPADPIPEATLLLPPAPATDARPTLATADQRLKPSSEHYHQQMLATMTALAMVLSARAPALLAVIGAFVLTLLAVIEPNPLKLYLTIGFDVGVLVPAVGLYWKRG